MDMSSIMDTQINVLDSVILSKHIGVLLFLMMQGVNMMSVVLYNCTAHELIANVNKI